MHFAKQIAVVFFGFFAAPAAATNVAAAQSGFDFPHKTDFLTAGCFTHLFPGLDATQRRNCIDQIKSRNYTHFYIYVYNENDYGGPSFDFYTDVLAYRTILQEITDAGLEVVVWLNPDDAPINQNRGIAALNSRMNDLVPFIDPLVSSYVLGLELNQYWGKSKVDALGKHLDTLTDKKIAVHQTRGRWDLCRFAWCDYMMLQYGFGKTEAEIQAMTETVMADLDKPVVAAEYSKDDESVSIRLGNAAVSVGAKGFGNGGTPDPDPDTDPAGEVPSVVGSKASTSSSIVIDSGVSAGDLILVSSYAAWATGATALNTPTGIGALQLVQAATLSTDDNYNVLLAVWGKIANGSEGGQTVTGGHTGSGNNDGMAHIVLRGVQPAFGDAIEKSLVKAGGLSSPASAPAIGTAGNNSRVVLFAAEGENDLNWSGSWTGGNGPDYVQHGFAHAPGGQDRATWVLSAGVAATGTAINGKVRKTSSVRPQGSVAVAIEVRPGGP